MTKTLKGEYQMVNHKNTEKVHGEKGRGDAVYQDKESNQGNGEKSRKSRHSQRNQELSSLMNREGACTVLCRLLLCSKNVSS